MSSLIDAALAALEDAATALQSAVDKIRAQQAAGVVTPAPEPPPAIDPQAENAGVATPPVEADTASLEQTEPAEPVAEQPTAGLEDVCPVTAAPHRFSPTNTGVFCRDCGIAANAEAAATVSGEQAAPEAASA